MLTKLTSLAFAIAVAGSIPVRGQRVPAGEAGAEVTVTLSGEVSRPRQMTLPAGTGVRDGLLDGGIVFPYGALTRTLLYRGDRVHRVPRSSEPDVILATLESHGR